MGNISGGFNSGACTHIELESGSRGRLDGHFAARNALNDSLVGLKGRGVEAGEISVNTFGGVAESTHSEGLSVVGDPGAREDTAGLHVDATLQGLGIDADRLPVASLDIVSEGVSSDNVDDG